MARSHDQHPTRTQTLARAIDTAYEACNVGQPDSAEQLYKAFRAQARNVIAYQLKSRDGALEHDIAQRAMMGLKSFRGESRVSTWFYRLAQNEVNRGLRERIQDRERLVPLDTHFPPDTQGDEGHESQSLLAVKPINHDAALDLEKLRQGLSPEQAEVLKLMAEGHSLEEIAGKIGLPLGTVRSRYRLAKRKIRPRATDNANGL